MERERERGGREGGREGKREGRRERERERGGDSKRDKQIEIQRAFGNRCSRAFLVSYRAHDYTVCNIEQGALCWFIFLRSDMRAGGHAGITHAHTHAHTHVRVHVSIICASLTTTSCVQPAE